MPAILKCIEIAEDELEIPALPTDWWDMISKFYNKYDELLTGMDVDLANGNIDMADVVKVTMAIKVIDVTKDITTLIFIVKNEQHERREIHVHMETVLECLKMAEDKVEIPKLPKIWWIQIARRYGIKIDLSK
jgi:hypothetical protein